MNDHYHASSHSRDPRPMDQTKFNNTKSYIDFTNLQQVVGAAGDKF